jgi:hypothetical protein
MRVVNSPKTGTISFSALPEGAVFRFVAGDALFMRSVRTCKYISLDAGYIYTKNDLEEEVILVQGAFVENYAEDNDDVPF